MNELDRLKHENLKLKDTLDFWNHQIEKHTNSKSISLLIGKYLNQKELIVELKKLVDDDELFIPKTILEKIERYSK